MLQCLEEVAGKPRRPITLAIGPYRKAVLAAKPLAYWPLDEIQGTQARDATGRGGHGTYEPGIARYLAGPASPAFCGEGVVHRAAHFAGGRMRADVKGLGATYSVELWVWNGLPNDARPVTGYFFSRGPDGKLGTPGDSLGIGGTHEAGGRLLCYNGDALGDGVAGATELRPKAWQHVVLVREGAKATVYLDGSALPEIASDLPAGCPPDCAQVFIGGRNDGFANFEGKIAEVAIYGRALSPKEAAEHHKAAAIRG